MSKRIIFWVFVCGLVFGAVCAKSATNPGQESFEKRCSGCHAPDRAKEGPALRGVFGRRAGQAANFPYSDVLKKANFTWDDASLDKWLKDPDALVPGTDMVFRLDDQAERAKIIGYLKQLK